MPKLTHNFFRIYFDKTYSDNSYCFLKKSVWKDAVDFFLVNFSKITEFGKSYFDRIFKKIIYD